MTVLAGPQYRAGWFHEIFFGRHYRDLWATPIQVEVLDLSRFAGGLTPIKRGGRRQTKSLRFRGGDGQEYVFRSVDKDPSAAMPPELRETFVERIIQDQISSSHPAGALVVSPLLEAGGVLHVEPRLFVMRDDPRLGEFRTEFAGMLGQLEERPTIDPDEEVGFAGAAKIVSTAKLWEHLDRDARHRVDSRALLAARLMDVYVGDWDRHADQWQWARFEKGNTHVWRPIPRDRDQAFSRLDGAFPWLARFYHVDLVGFGDRYPDILGLTWDGRALDRRLLVVLEKPVWDSVASALQRRLTDSLLEVAVLRLPVEYYERDGRRLVHALRQRRDHLREVSDRYYALLAGKVDVHATDDAEVGEIDCGTDGSVSVRLSRSSRASPGSPGVAYFSRTFHHGETQEVRLYLHGGDDRVIVRGSRPRQITVRVIGGDGDDELVDSSRAGARFYDARGNNRFVTGSRTSVNRRPYSSPPATHLEPIPVPPRDWGSRWTPSVRVSYLPDFG